MAAVATQMAFAGNAAAATELAEIADGRIGTLATLLVIAVGWVGFQILNPALNQLDEMSEKAKSRQGLIAGLGLGGSALVAGQADAAQEVMGQVADGRLGTLATLLVVAVGWVLFQILNPALNQLDEMNEKAKSRKGLIAGLGLGASALAAGQADAAQEVMGQVADGRIFTLGTLLVVAVGWVGFQILNPALNQLDEMNEKAKSRKVRFVTCITPESDLNHEVSGLIAGLGLGGSALVAGQADAAQEVMGQVADGRIGTLATLLVIAVGWVGFQILNPALNQLDEMNEKAKSRQ
ncbi:unnamed protein product [Pedinophyceae sp. YPF-701]|nr:unnamed protein product [Pedinophyceae sp. YPF-701]